MPLALFLQQPQMSPEQIQHIAMGVLAILPVIILIVMAIIIVPCWFICKKAGFSPWLSLICVVPSVGMLILLYVLAFAEWKVAPVAPQQMPYPYPPAPPRV